MLVIKVVDGGNWITVCKRSVPFKVSTAMAAEVAGACILEF